MSHAVSGVSGVNSGSSQSISGSSVIPENDPLLRISSVAQEIITSESHQEEDETLESFLDPVTFEIMEDPVITSSGRSYERSTIEDIINNGDGRDPFTREPLMLPLIPNRALKNAIGQWKKSSLLTKERSNQIIRNAQEVKRKQIEDERRIKEKNDAINKFHEELFAQKPEGHSCVGNLDNFEEKGSKEKEEMREMRKQIEMLQRKVERITGSGHMGQSSSSSSVMAAAPRIPIVHLPRIAFGEEDWKRYVGEVEKAPPFPANMGEILQSPCPIWKRKRVMDTHLLTLIPRTVNGRPLTLDYLEELIQRPKGGGHATKYRFYSDYVREDFGNEPSSQAYWALMTKDVLPGSRNKTYKDQLAMAEDLKRRTGVDYGLPPVLGGAVSILMHHAKTGERLYSGNSWTWTRCQDLNKYGDPAAFGGFSADGLRIARNYDGSLIFGVAVFRKFY